MISEEDKALELILQYGMSDLEAKAFKIACIYIKKSKVFFPDYKHYRMPKGDPRKSELFRYCHKLVREKDGKMQDEDYPLYIHAQLDILKNIDKGGVHPFISPSCIAGEKAWRRWLLWKSRFDKAMETRASKQTSETIDIHSTTRIKRELRKTKNFFLAWFDRLEEPDIVASLEDGEIFRWYGTGSVSGYYFLISNLVKEWMRKNPQVDIKKEYGINMEVYKGAELGDEIINYFYEEFYYEKKLN